MPLITRTDVERVALSTPGEWVEIKRRLSKGDRTALMALAAQFKVAVSPDGDMQASDMSMDVAAALDALTFRGLEIGLMAWSFPEEVTPANIRLLSEEDYDIVQAAANELWKSRTKEESDFLGGNGAAPYSPAASRQEISPGS